MGRPTVSVSTVPMRNSPRRHRRGAVLRALLVDDFGWTPCDEPTVLIAIRRRVVRVTELARRGERVARICEWPGHSGVLDYQTRRELHARLGEAGGRDLSIFPDAAATVEVWAHTSFTADRIRAYREVTRVRDGEPPRRFIHPPPEPPARTGDEALACGAGAEAARLALLRRLRRAFPLLPRGLGPLRGRPAGQQLQDFVERSRSPDDLRRIWKEIEGLRILDPSCGDGAWLCGCLDGLTTVGMACLHRMRVWIDTQQRTAARRRPEMLADFRAVLERAAELARTGGEERFVVETILLRCLHGVSADRLMARRSQRRLAARLRVAPGQLSVGPDAFAGIVTGDIAGGLSSPDDLARFCLAVPSLAPAAHAIASEAEMLARAEQLLVRGRLREGESVEELAAGRAAIRKRRAALTEALSRHAAGGITAGAVHPCIEYHGVLRAGGFDLVRPRDDRSGDSPMGHDGRAH